MPVRECCVLLRARVGWAGSARCAGGGCPTHAHHHPLSPLIFPDAIGTAALLFCLGAGALYQQPPMRKSAVRKSADDVDLLDVASGPKIAALRVGEKSVV